MVFVLIGNALEGWYRRLGELGVSIELLDNLSPEQGNEFLTRVLGLLENHGKI